MNAQMRPWFCNQQHSQECREAEFTHLGWFFQRLLQKSLSCDIILRGGQTTTIKQRCRNSLKFLKMECNLLDQEEPSSSFLYILDYGNRQTVFSNLFLEIKVKQKREIFHLLVDSHNGWAATYWLQPVQTGLLQSLRECLVSPCPSAVCHFQIILIKLCFQQELAFQVHFSYSYCTGPYITGKP